MGKMMKTDVVNGHYHLIYARDEGIGVCSFDKGHDHPVMEMQGEVPDMKTWIVGMFEEHNHKLSDYPEPDRFENPSDEENTAENVLELYKKAKEVESDFRKTAYESEKFYRGEQWERGMKEELESNKRPALTLNYIEGMIDFLSGTFRQNRMDWRWKPTEGGDSLICDILNIITKNIANRTQLDSVKNQVFEDVCITGRGFFEIWVDYDEDIRGRLRIKRCPWDLIYMGPHEELDGSDCEYLTKKMWFSVAELINLYPEKASDIVKMFFSQEEEVQEDKELHIKEPGGGAKVSVIRPEFSFRDPDLINIATKSVGVLEQWRKVYYTAPIFVDPTAGTEGFTYNAYKLPVNEITKMKTIGVLKLIERRIFKMRVTKIAGTVVLSDEYPDLGLNAPLNGFDVIVVYAKKRGKYCWGKVEAGKDAQREINKRRSQAIDILNRVSAYGRWYDDETFDGEKELSEAKRNISKPGFFLKLRNANNPPAREEGIKFPNELIQMDQISLASFRLITNVNPEIMPQGLTPTSGVAIARRIQQGFTGNEYLYDNFAMALGNLGRYIIAVIQQSDGPYPAERIMRIIQNQAQKERILIGGRQLMVEGMPRELQAPQNPEDIITMEEVGKLYTNTDLLEYDVECGEGASSPTARQANAIMLLELTKAGVPIPPEVLIDHLDFPDKEKVLFSLRQQTQQTQALEAGKQQTEIMKTQIAANAKQQGRVGQLPTPTPIPGQPSPLETAPPSFTPPPPGVGQPM